VKTNKRITFGTSAGAVKVSLRIGADGIDRPRPTYLVCASWESMVHVGQVITPGRGGKLSASAFKSFEMMKRSEVYPLSAVSYKNDNFFP
jgi:hypothetical protein